ncbi:MAG TPA: F0F1 ATP synthase subunit B, partial [Paracoccus sp.]|nr:F0F1 ATP synthase subunit B [Paracoccus sp. (in: a-proteobacteria)]
MELDWFTLIAQIINFLVLVALLRQLFYGRLIGAMDTREANIRTRLDTAAQAREVAEQEAETYRSRNQAFDEQREAMLAQAGDEAEAHRRELLDSARVEAGKAQAKWLAALENERADLLDGFRERLGHSAFSIASQGLKQLADARLEEQIVRVFIDRIQTLDPAERDKIIAEVKG